MEKRIYPLHNQKIGSWRYASGVLAVREEKLLARRTIEDLFQVQTEEDLLHQISSQYRGETMEEALREAREADAALLRKLAPEALYPLFAVELNEGHNLRRSLKAYLMKNLTAEEGDRQFLGPYFHTPTELQKKIEKKTQELSGSMTPGPAAAPLGGELGPDWVDKAIAKALQDYRDTQEVSSLGTAVDQAYFARYRSLLKESKNPWLQAYGALAIDQVNLGILLRTKKLGLAPEVFQEAYLVGGGISQSTYEGALTALASQPSQEESKLVEKADQHEADHHKVVSPLKLTSPYLNEEESYQLAQLISFAGSDAARQYSAYFDQIRGRYLEEASLRPGTAEKAFSYFAYRAMERKNLQLILAAVRNHLDREEVKKLLRPCYKEQR